MFNQCKKCYNETTVHYEGLCPDCFIEKMGEGEGEGNWGHKGRPGEVGGSGEGSEGKGETKDLSFESVEVYGGGKRIKPKKLPFLYRDISNFTLDAVGDKVGETRGGVTKSFKFLFNIRNGEVIIIDPNDEHGNVFEDNKKIIGDFNLDTDLVRGTYRPRQKGSGYGISLENWSREDWEEGNSVDSLNIAAEKLANNARLNDDTSISIWQVGQSNIEYSVGELKNLGKSEFCKEFYMKFIEKEIEIDKASPSPKQGEIE